MFICIRKAAEFVKWVNKPISEANQIRSGENWILEAGIMPTQYQEWRLKIKPDCSTWLHFTAFWANAFDTYYKCIKTAKSVGFGGNVEEKQDKNNPLKRLCKVFTKNKGAL